MRAVVFDEQEHGHGGKENGQEMDPAFFLVLNRIDLSHDARKLRRDQSGLGGGNVAGP